MPIYAPGVAVGISQKMKEEPGRIVDNRLNRLVKFDQVSDYGVNQALTLITPHRPLRPHDVTKRRTELVQEVLAWLDKYLGWIE